MISFRLRMKGINNLQMIKDIFKNELALSQKSVRQEVSPMISSYRLFMTQFTNDSLPLLRLRYNYQIFNKKLNNSNAVIYKDLKSILHNFNENNNITREQYFSLCSLVWEYYRFDKMTEYLSCRGQLQKMLQFLKTEFLKGLNLQEIASLINFIRIAFKLKLKHPNLQSFATQLTKELYKNQKIILNLPLIELMKLFSILNGLNNHKSYYDLINKIQKHIQKTVLNKQIIMSISQIGMLMQSLTQSRLFSKENIQLYKMALIRVKQHIQTIDSVNLCKIVICLLNKQIQLIVEPQLLQTINRLYSKVQQFLNNKKQWPFLVQSLLSIQLNNPINRQIYISIYNNLMAQTNNKYIPQECFTYFPLLLQKLRFHEFSFKQKQQFIKILKSYHDRCQQKQLHYFGMKLIGYVQSNYFKKDIYLIDSIMKKGRIVIFWDYILQYSYAGVKFPMQILIKKIKQPSLYFKKQDFFLVIAICISKQSKLHKDAALEAHRNTILESIRKEKWTIEHIDFFLRQDFKQKILLQNFFQQFSQYFIHNLNSLCHNKSQYLKKYNELLLCIFLNSNLPKSALKQISMFQLDKYLMRYMKICKNFMSINPTLIFALTTYISSIKIPSNKSDLMLITTTIKLIYAYYKTIIYETADIQHLFINLIIQIINMYKFLGISNCFTLMEIINKLICNKSNEVFYGSKQHKILIDAVVKNKNIMEQNYQIFNISSKIDKLSQVNNISQKKSPLLKHLQNK